MKEGEPTSSRIHGATGSRVRGQAAYGGALLDDHVFEGGPSGESGFGESALVGGGEAVADGAEAAASRAGQVGGRAADEPGGGLLPVAPGNAELSLPVQRGSEVVEDNLGRPCRVRRIIILYWRGALHNLSRFGLASTLILTLIEWRTGRG